MLGSLTNYPADSKAPDPVCVVSAHEGLLIFSFSG